MGLFLADQQLGGHTAVFTRQNPGGGQSGLECPEERDYYPYWHPAPWIDIAVLTDDTSRCSFYKANSQNGNVVNYCSQPQYNNANDCITGNGTWNWFSHSTSNPDCTSTPYSRDNHLGNTLTGYTAVYNWTLPNDNLNQCILRIRYNVSSGDYDGWNTFSDQNNNPHLNITSPVYQDPYVQPFNDGQQLRLALNTDQYGRTFQDRSYMFNVLQRPGYVGSLERIWNLNVRGKRGNIVQVYPAVEYDFTPNRLPVRVGDWIHFQWTGCDTNPLGNDGEGTYGTDRSNLIFIDDLDLNLNGSQSFLVSDDAQGFGFLGLDPSICATALQALQNATNNQDTINRDPSNCAKLNAASRYFDGGLVHIKQTHNGNTYHYMSTRNNNFTNRSQKGTITVVPFLPLWAIILVCFAAFVMLCSLIILGFGIWARVYPDGRVAEVFRRIPF